MKNYDLELTIALDDHGLQQALALQAKTGRGKSKIVKAYAGGTVLVNSDGSVAKEAFAPNKTIRINLIAHGGAGASEVADTAEARSWGPEAFATFVHGIVRFALPPARAAQMIQRISMIVCYGGGHTYVTQNEYGHHIHPSNSFGYKFFSAAKGWVTDVTARGDISTTRMLMRPGAQAGSLDGADYTGAYKIVGDDNARKDRYRKVRFYAEGDAVGVEWPYEGYD